MSLHGGSAGRGDGYGRWPEAKGGLGGGAMAVGSGAPPWVWLYPCKREVHFVGATGGEMEAEVTGG